MDFPNLISIDAAGTLIRPRESVGKTYARFAAIHGENVTPAALESAFREAFAAAPSPFDQPGNPSSDGDRAWWKAMVASIFARCNCDFGEPSGAQRFDNLFGDLFEHFGRPEAWELYPEIEEALERLAAHSRLWLLSNFDPRLHPVIDGLGIGHYFEGRTVSSEVGYAKPEREIFEHMLQTSGVRADQSAHLGDDPVRDARGAQEVGILPFLVNRPTEDILTFCNRIEEVGFSDLRKAISWR